MYHTHQKGSLLNYALPLIFSVIASVTFWELAKITLRLPSIILPSPWESLLAFKDSWRYIVPNLAMTAAEAILGLLLGISGSVLLSTAFILSSFAKRSIYPLALMLKATPLVALAPLIVLWLGSGIASKVAMSALLCFFPVLVSLYDGLMSTNRDLLDFMRLYGASPIQILLKARLPSALPQVFTGLRTAVPLAAVGSILGEYLSASYGIGYIIASASYNMDTALVFASLACVTVITLVAFGIVVYLEHIIVHWNPK